MYDQLEYDLRKYEREQDELERINDAYNRYLEDGGELEMEEWYECTHTLK
jgi:hypothetical protein